MPVFRVVEFWPATGLPAQPWLDDPDADAFVRTARRVCELYSEGLAPAALTGRAQSLRLFTVPGPKQSDVVEVEIHERFHEGFEAGYVGLPVGVAHLSPHTRANLVLEVIHAAATQLAGVRGWPAAAFDIARRHVLEHNFRFQWATAWKSSRNRVRQARAVFDLTDDGTGRVVLEVRDVKTGAVVARSREAVAFSTIEGFKRSARTLRWDGESVEITAAVDPWGEHSPTLRLDLPADGLSTTPLTASTTGPDPTPNDAHGAGTASSEAEDPNLEPLPQVRVRTVPAVPDAHTISFVGGGPTNGVPVAYLNAVDLLLEIVQRDFVQWWSRADRPLLELWYEFGRSVEGPMVRRLKGKVIARIHRDPHTIQAAPDPVELAREDVTALVDSTAAKLGLGPPPQLPSSARVHEKVAEQLAATDRYKKAGSALLERLRGRLPDHVLALFLEDLRDPDQVDIGSGLRFNLGLHGVTLNEGEQQLLDQL